ncbi:MAG: hypothetical protein LBR69_03085 [Endomicrobium sp.]|jgi:hypothetical protein|nr:hypothetical protein [Endomicrobium sp.]
MPKKDIKIDAAQEVSEKSGYPIIVIYGYDPKDGMQHVTTFGKSKQDCLDACKCGNWLKKQLGWPPKMCNAKPKRTVLKGKK